MRYHVIFFTGHLLFGLILFFFIIVPSTVAGEEQTALWRELGSGNHFAILRHALAPGMGDPQEFNLNDCTTQRNLSDEGRKQARLIGQRFQSQGYKEARVYSSQWCRCLETAKLLNLGEVQELPVLNSFFADFGKEEQRTRQLREWLGHQDLSEVIVLVSHQVNITALTGIYPRSGELVVVERTNESFVVKGTLITE